MILFENDWKTHKSAIPDYETTNRSWVRICSVLYKMGIKNCLFPLALHNPALQGVNPRDPNLTQDQIKMITTEAKENPWYALREIIRLPPVAGPDPVQISANRANIALWWLFLNHITSMLLQPRQTGKSVSTDALMVALLTIAAYNTDIHLLTKDDSLRVKNVSRIKTIIENLPFYFKLKERGDTNNTEKVTINRLGNSYLTAVAQASPKAALNLGRGMTIAVNHIDEIAYISNIDVTLPALLAAASAARDAAKQAHAPYGNIFTTTPGYLSTTSGRFTHSIYVKGFKWTEKLYDSLNEEALRSIIKKNSTNGDIIVILDFNHRQLGFSDDWVREKISEAMTEGENAGADFLNIWAEGSERSPIKKELLKIIRDSVDNDPYIEVSTFGYTMRWHIEEEEVTRGLHDRHLVGILDSSDAVGKDDMGFVIRDANTGEVLAAGNHNETNLITYSEWLMDWLLRYDNLTLVIERRSSGVAIIDNLIRLCVANDIDPFKRIFNWVVNDSHTNAKYRDTVTNVPFNRRDPLVYDIYRDKFGFATSGAGRTSRNVLYGEVFNSSIKYTGNTVRDKTLIDQISGLTIKNDRIDHKSGEHDDLVISWLLGYWFLTKTENKTYYGIKTHQVLSTVMDTMVEEQGGADAIVEKAFQTTIKKQIDTYLELLKNESSYIRSELLANKIKQLYKYIDTKYVQNFNLESVLDAISMEKKRSGYNKRRY